MKIVFFGNPEFCNHPLLKLNDSKHSIVSVVTNKDKKSGRGLKLNQTFVKKLSLDLNLPIIEVDDINSNELHSKLTSLNADIFIVDAFSILPDSIINIPKYGAINIHPSILPKYRGASPIQYALLNGDDQTGVSIISLNQNIDAGNILGQEKIFINKNDTFGYLYEKLSILGSELLIKVINNLELKKIKPIIQDNSLKTLAPKIKKEDLKICWNQSSSRIHNHIRSFDPYPGAYAILENKRIKLFLSSEYFGSSDIGSNAVEGELIIKDQLLLVKTNTKKMINVGMVQLEGRKKISSSDFIKTLKNKKYILK